MVYGAAPASHLAHVGDRAARRAGAPAAVEVVDPGGTQVAVEAVAPDDTAQAGAVPDDGQADGGQAGGAPVAFQAGGVLGGVQAGGAQEPFTFRHWWGRPDLPPHGTANQ